MEALLHFAWAHRLYTELTLPLGGAKSLEIIDPGCYNTDAGADFHNAKIRLDDMVWCGDIELHTSGRDWSAHKHDQDPAYASVILHIVAQDPVPVYDLKGREVLCAQMLVPDALQQRAQYLVDHSAELPCAPLRGVLCESDRAQWLSTLLQQRLEARLEMQMRWMDLYRADRYEVLYILLMRYLGFGLNNDAMERLARSLPLRYLLKHRDKLSQLEALLLGQSGLLTSLPEQEYIVHLREEYRFLAHKYGLSPLPEGVFRLARTRPASFPMRRILQLAALLHGQDFIADLCLEARDIQGLTRAFGSRSVSPSWPIQASPLGDRLDVMSTSSIIALGINVAAPYQWLVAHLEGRTDLRKRALGLLASLPCEENRITRLMRRAGVQMQNSADSQAILELYKMYCQRKKCLFCPWGRAKIKGLR